MTKPTEKEFAATVDRVKVINDQLKAQGYNWEEIDQFWAEIFRKVPQPPKGERNPKIPQL